MNDTRYYDDYMQNMRIVDKLGRYKLIESEFLIEGFSDSQLEVSFEDELMEEE